MSFGLIAAGPAAVAFVVCASMACSDVEVESRVMGICIFTLGKLLDALSAIYCHFTQFSSNAVKLLESLPMLHRSCLTSDASWGYASSSWGSHSMFSQLYDVKLLHSLQMLDVTRFALHVALLFMPHFGLESLDGDQAGPRRSNVNHYIANVQRCWQGTLSTNVLMNHDVLPILRCRQWC